MSRLIRTLCLLLVLFVGSAACSGSEDAPISEPTGTEPEGSAGETNPLPESETPVESTAPAASGGEPIGPLVLDYDDISFRPPQDEEFADGFVGVLVAGDCSDAYDQFSSINYAESTDFETFDAQVCSRVTGTAPVQVYVGEPSGFGDADRTVAYQIGDEYLLVKTFDSVTWDSILGIEWADEPRDIE